MEKSNHTTLLAQTQGLNEPQIMGIRAGLTREQVNHVWFSYAHAEAAEKNIPYEQYRELTSDQVFLGILKGLTHEQVHGLNAPQIMGICAGLTREQVNHVWFSYAHAAAAEKNIPYEQYRELTSDQVLFGIIEGLTREQVRGLNGPQIRGIRAGLTREQVNHDWFSYYHAIAAEKNIPYNEKLYSSLIRISITSSLEELAALYEIAKKNGFSKEQLQQLNDPKLQIPALMHGLPFDKVVALEGDALQTTLEAYRTAQQRAFRRSFAFLAAHPSTTATDSKPAATLGDLTEADLERINRFLR